MVHKISKFLREQFISFLGNICSIDKITKLIKMYKRFHNAYHQGVHEIKATCTR